MKKVMVIVMALCLLCSSAWAAKVSLLMSNTVTVPVKLESNTDVASMHFSVTGLPIASVTCSDANKVVDFYGSKVIVYGLNNNVIMNGNVVNITFTTPQPYGSYPIVITPLSGATGSAVSATIVKGTDGSVSLTFSNADIIMEKDFIVGRSVVGGLDINNDTKVDCADLQIMINNR